jgi:hypothetical protein
VLRADPGAYRRWFGRPIQGLRVLLGVVVGGVIASFRRGDGLVIVAIIAATVVLSLAFVAILIATSRVVVTSDHIEHRRWFVRTRLRRRDLIGALAELEMSPVGRTSQVLVLRSRSGGRRIWLNGAYWDQSDLLHVARAAGVPVLDGVRTPRDFQRVAPGSMPYRILHPWVVGTGGAVVLVAVIVAAVVAWFDVNELPPFDEQPPRAVPARTIQEQDALATSVQRAIGGAWAAPDVRLDECKDAGDRRGWSRRVSVELRRTMDEATGEDSVDTPIAPTPELIAAIDAELIARGLPELYGDLDDLQDGDGYAQFSSFAADDGGSDVDITFGTGDDVGLMIDSACETPAR